MSEPEVLPAEMVRALEQVKRDALEVRDRADKAVTTASDWLAGRPAHDFAMSGNYARFAGDLEASVARVRAYRDIAWKLQPLEGLRISAGMLAELLEALEGSASPEQVRDLMGTLRLAAKVEGVTS